MKLKKCVQKNSKIYVNFGFLFIKIIKIQDPNYLHNQTFSLNSGTLETKNPQPLEIPRIL